MKWVDSTGNLVLEVLEGERVERGEVNVGGMRVWYWINPGLGEMIVDLSGIEFDFMDFSGEWEFLEERKLKLSKGIIVVGKKIL